MFEIAQSDLDELREHTQGGEKYLRWFPVEIRDDAGALVARVRRQMYVRRTRNSAVSVHR